MAIDDPNIWVQAASAVKTTFESIRTAIGLEGRFARLVEAMSNNKKQLTLRSRPQAQVPLLQKRKSAKRWVISFAYAIFRPH